MIFRTEIAKQDLVLLWNRPDRPFFAAGACHILAGVFLETYPDAGYHALFIRPQAGFRGRHVVVSNGSTVFDYHGYTNEAAYFAHYLLKIRRFFPKWRGSIEQLNESPSEESFCQKFSHRMPDQFWHDPRHRAASYLRRFEPPKRSEAESAASSLSHSVRMAVTQPRVG